MNLKRLFTAGLTFLILSALPLVGQDQQLPRRTPESQGVSSAQVRAFVIAADKQVNSMHSFMLVRNGSVVAETWWTPHSAEKPHVLWSLSKSFTSTAIGMAISDGKLNLDDPVHKFFPDETPKKLSTNLKKMTVKDLLTMSAGHDTELNWRREKNWAKGFLRHPIPHEPGSHFRYNTPATYMLSAIHRRVTGEGLVDYLEPRLFKPLGIKTPRWDKSPQGIEIGGYGLYLRTEDIAKFGQLYLQKGEWNGKQLVAKKWIKMASSKQVSNGDSKQSDWQQGYGFQFWVCRHGAFRGDGKDGQFCIVLPKQNAVVAITANTGNLQGVLNLVWKNLLPAFKEGILEENPDEHKRLKAAMSGLKASR